MPDQPPVIYELSADEYERILDYQLKASNEAYGHATAYDTAITIGGYGAFFALWVAVADDVTPVARLLTAGLIGISLLFYILWQTLSMLVRHGFDRKYAAVVQQPLSPLDKIIALNALEARRMLGVELFNRRFWMPVYATSIVTGLAGGMILTYNCVAAAIGLPQLTG